MLVRITPVPLAVNCAVTSGELVFSAVIRDAATLLALSVPP
jgi:hypothetical protein